MLYKIKGVNPGTGKAMPAMRIEAVDEKTAVAVAVSRGMTVTSVVCITPQVPKAPITRKSVMKAVSAGFAATRSEPPRYKPPTKARKSYPWLSTLANLYRITAVLTIIIAFVGVIQGLRILGGQGDEELAWTLLIGSAIWGLFSFITAAAIGEGIDLVIDVVAILQDIRDRLSKQ